MEHQGAALAIWTSSHFVTRMCVLSSKEHTDKLDEVLGIVVAHQGAKLAAKLAGRLLAALVEPTPEAYRQVLRRLAALEGETAIR